MTRKIICDGCAGGIRQRYRKEMKNVGPPHRSVSLSEIAERGGGFSARKLVPTWLEGMLMPDGQDGPAEWGKLVSGRMRHDVVCDLCSARLETGKFCWAWSVYTKRTPYFEWEGQFLELTAPNAEGEAADGPKEGRDAESGASDHGRP